MIHSSKHGEQSDAGNRQPNAAHPTSEAPSGRAGSWPNPKGNLTHRSWMQTK